MQITAIIYTYNEQNNIKDCIDSLDLLTKQIVVVDMESSDRTVELAKKSGAAVYSFPYSPYVEPSREFGINQAKTDWVLLLDADERMTKKLAIEIAESLENSTYTHFKIARKNIFGNTRWLKHGGWWPDHQTRLINKKYFETWPQEIHSTPRISGDVGILMNPLLHYFHGDFNSMVNKTIIFEDIESDLLFNAGKKVSTIIFFKKFFGELYRRLVKSLGFLDGQIGIIESIYQAYSKTITYLYLYEKKINRTL